MISGRRFPLFCAGLLVMTIALRGPAHAEITFHQARVGPEEIADLKSAILDAHSVVIAHTARRRIPVSFTTTRPCRLQTELGRFERTWGGDRVIEVAQVIGVTRIQSPVPDSTLRGCQPDTVRSEAIELTFGKGKRAIRVILDVAAGICTYTWNDSLSISDLVEAGDLRALMKKALPDDSLLDEIPPCEPRTASADRPRWGERIWVEELPEVVTRVAPSYPEDARRAGLEGTVWLNALVNRSGEVAETLIAHSLPAFDQQAVLAVEQWRFKPALARGEPTAVWVAIPIKFSLR